MTTSTAPEKNDEKEPAPEEPPAPEERPMPTNVYEAVARVMAELPGIGKDDRAAPEQGAYAYRGIESITRHAQQLFGKYGVVFVLEETGYMVENIEVNNRPWTDTTITCVYHVHGPGGADDVLNVGPIHVVGRDNSDKGANKCRTQAFKYALLQLLCVGDQKDDADSGSPEADQKAKPRAEQTPEERAREERAKFRHERLGNLTPAQRDAFRAWADEKEFPRVTGAWTDEQLELATEKVDEIVQEQAPDDAHDAATAADEQDKDAEAENRDVAPPAREGPDDQPKAGPPALDVSDLPTGREPTDDLRWLVKAPDAVVEEVVEETKDVAKDELPTRLKALGLPVTGNEDQKRQRLTSRIIRIRMERLAGVAPAEGAAE